MHYPLLLCMLFLAGGISAQDDPCLCMERFGTDELYTPTFFKTAPGDDDRIFVGEQRGYIWIYDREGNRDPEPMINITGRMQLFDYEDCGLLSLAFHPDFQNNRKFYIYFVEKLLDPNIARLSEFQMSEENPDVADMDTERVILDIANVITYEIHHIGGEVFFDVDNGLLFLSVGDGYFNNENAQNVQLLQGNVLRIDIDTGDDDIPYLIPEDNPFVNHTDFLPEIYAMGFRQPYRCTMDEGDSETGEGRGRIFCADVGEWHCEEVDIVVAGGNYAWPWKECIYCFPSEPELVECIDDPVVTPGEEVLPIFWYTEYGPGGQSITGGHVYRGSDIPAYYGDYFWTDYVVKFTSGLSRLRENEDGTWSNAGIPLCDANACGEELVSEHQLYLFAYGQDQEREMYVLESDNVMPTQGGAAIYKLVDPESWKKGR